MPRSCRRPCPGNRGMIVLVLTGFAVILAGCGEEGAARKAGRAESAAERPFARYAVTSPQPTSEMASVPPRVALDVAADREATDPPSTEAPADEVEHNTEAYSRIEDNPFLAVSQNPLSTFSIDVDTASYANVRRFLLAQNMLPPPDAVRIEELVNYFRYDYEPPIERRPVRRAGRGRRCPWAPKHRLARIALKGQEIDLDKRPLTNLVFLLDVSGSMNEPNKLPLVKEAMRLLVEQLGENDRVAIVVYASAEGLALPSTSGDHKEEILSAIDQLEAGGSTAGGAGIQLAYKVAAEHFIKGGINRVILCTDGDFNVGVSDEGSLSRLIEQKAKTGVFLSVLGFGTGNYKDAKMESLADHGNGNYAYIDSLEEARKVLVEQIGGTLVTIAKDVKIQVEFNPAQVQAYRLIGYENRMLRTEDFNDDTKDAGEIGAGHTVTALYEIVPPGVEIDLPDVRPLKYQDQIAFDSENADEELMNVALRYKEPDGDTSQLIEMPVKDEGKDFAESDDDTRFAAAVAAFGMILRDSPYKGTANLDAVLELAGSSIGDDPEGYRREFLQMVGQAKELKPE